MSQLRHCDTPQLRIFIHTISAFPPAVLLRGLPLLEFQNKQPPLHELVPRGGQIDRFQRLCQALAPGIDGGVGEDHRLNAGGTRPGNG